MLVGLALVVVGAGCARRRPAVDPDVELSITRGIAFAETADGPLALDLYTPRDGGEERLPVVVWLHGGGWLQGDRSNLPRDLARTLVGRGYAVASVSYRLSSTAPFPAQIYDVKAALRFLRANAAPLGLDPERIGIMGVSAGGHLAALAGTTQGRPRFEGDVGGEALAAFSSRVGAVVNYFGPTDLTSLAVDGSGGDVERLLEALLGGDLSERRRLARDASPIAWVSADAAPMLHVHGTRDELVPFEQSERMHAALRGAGVASVLRPVPGAGHGHGGDFETGVLSAEVADFFDRTLGR